MWNNNSIATVLFYLVSFICIVFFWLNCLLLLMGVFFCVCVCSLFAHSTKDKWKYICTATFDLQFQCRIINNIWAVQKPAVIFTSFSLSLSGSNFIFQPINSFIVIYCYFLRIKQINLTRSIYPRIHINVWHIIGHFWWLYALAFVCHVIISVHSKKNAD